MTVSSLLNHGASKSKTALVSEPSDQDLVRERSSRKFGKSEISLFKIAYYIFFVILLLIFFSRYSINLCGQSETQDNLQYEDTEFISRLLEDPTLALTSECANVLDDRKLDCFPRGSVNESTCVARGCCWSARAKNERITESAKLDVPWCYYPKNHSSYVLINTTQENRVTTTFWKNVIKSPYPNDAPILKMTVTPETNNRIHLVVKDATKKSFETPYPETPIMRDSTYRNNLNYEVHVEDDGPRFKIQRKSDGKILMDSRGGLIFSSQLIQFSTDVLSGHLYGLAEHRDAFHLDTNWKRITLFNHDSPPTNGINGYGTHPFFLSVGEDGRGFGVLLKNSHPMEIILQPAPTVTYRVLGGVLDFYVFLGPSPSEVISQYLDVVGYPFMPPYWSLGFHMCKYGQQSLQVTMDTLNRTQSAGIPVDVQWNDLDYMENNNDFTRNKVEFAKLPEFIKHLHDSGMHYIPILDPGVSAGEPKGTYPPYDQGIAANIFIKNASGLPIVGKVWNKVSTVFPDFTNPDTIDYWTNQLKSLHDDIPFDGVWIDMNEPSNFIDGSFEGCPNNEWENPPYVPVVEGGHLNYKTLCMSSEHYLGKHYQIHNVHGITEAIATNFALKEIRNKRPFIVSRSTFLGQGMFSAHWTGDVWSTWDDMKHTVSDIMTFNLLGIPMVGADICGFNGNTTAALCQRWLQLGAFYPFSRTHNSDDTIDQDPVAMGQSVVDSTRKALLIRYSLLPYLYSLFWRAHAFGETVVRPLFFEFPTDTRTFNISTQFMWGSALQIVPVLNENDVYVKAYLPGKYWYNFYYGQRVVGGDVALSAPLDVIPLLVKPGTIMPGQVPAMTTTESRTKPFVLVVALDDDGIAEGFLYWDDGESLNTYHKKLYNLITFSASNNSVSSSIEHFGFETPMSVVELVIFGVTSAVKSVEINGQNAAFIYKAKNETLVTTNQNINLKDKFVVSWSFA